MKVCFHSREIRRRTGPFDIHVINYDNFLESLTQFLQSIDFTIFHSYINKQELFERYDVYSQSPYELAVTFILERLVGKLLKDNESVVLVFESRGKKEDKILHEQIMKILNYGTYYIPSSKFSKIKGVYFNNKRTPDNQKTIYGLEIADLVSYPIFKYCKNNNCDLAFESIKSKIYNYPKNGHGLKRFP